MLSWLQREVGQAQWSDLLADYSFGFSYKGDKRRDDIIMPLP